MSYTPTNWETGDVITAQKLNKLEQGVAGAGGVLIATDTNGTIDKTWQEVHDADFAVIKETDGDVFLVMQVVSTPVYGIACLDISATQWLYSAETADGYPVRQT